MGLVVSNDSGTAKYTEKNRNRGQGSFRDGNAFFMRLAQMKGLLTAWQSGIRIIQENELVERIQ